MESYLTKDYLYNQIYFKRMKRMKQLIYICMVSVLAISCDNLKKDKKAKESGDKVEIEAADKTKAYSIDRKNTSIKQFETKKDCTKTQITVLKKKLVDIKKRVIDLEELQGEFKKRITDLKSTSEATYYKTKLGLDSVMIEIDHSIAEVNKGIL